MITNGVQGDAPLAEKQAQAVEAKPKRPLVPPRLTKLGSLAKVTRQFGGGSGGIV